jgi:hypothetical protein
VRRKKPTTAELLERALCEIASLRSEVANLRSEVQTLRMSQPITLPSWPPYPSPPIFTEPTCPPPAVPAQPPLPRRYRTEPDWWPEVWCNVKAAKSPSNFIH